jgi:hypothetical protein
MANTDKDILITPNIGSSNDPKIEFKGASSTVGPSTITATIYPLEGGTLSFDGSQGSLFSISNNLTSGSIFSVNPISGIPIIDINADRTIALNPYGGNTGIGLTNPSSLYKFVVSGNSYFNGTSSIINKSWASYGNNSIDGYSWVDAAFTTNSIEIVNNQGAVTNSSPTLAFHRYGSGGPQFRLDATGTNILYLESAQPNSARNPNAQGTTYFASLRLTSSDTNGIYVNGNTILHAGNYNSYAPTLTGTGASGTWGISITGNAATATIVNGTSGHIQGKDDRVIEPNSITAGRMQFGFTSWANNDTAPYADYLHLRSYTDSSGGSDNLVMFKKDGIGMRIWQQSFGSASAYSSYVDVLDSNNYNSYAPTLTGTGASGTWGISITGNANSADLIDGIAFRNSDSTSPITAPDTLNSNGIGYVSTGISLYSQTDGALYSQAYDSTWQHQIYGDYRTGQIAIRGKNSGTWQAWRRVLDNTSYSASNSWTPNYGGLAVPSFVPGTFTKSGGANGWDSQVYSTEGYITNVYVSCSAAQTNGHIMFGLNSDPTTNANYSTLDYAIYFTGGGNIEIYESNVEISTHGTYATTDIFSIVYDGTHIIYYKNNTILRRVARAISTTKLYFDTSFYTPNSSITGVSYGTFNTPDFKPSNDQYQVDINAPAAANGSWTTNSSTDEWGNPKFDKIYNGYRRADASGADVWLQYNVPSGMKSAWISQLCWDTGGYVDVYGVQSGGQLVFLRRINTRQTVENVDEGVNHDGSTVTFAASGLDDYTAIRFIVKSGRFHLTGLSFSSADNEGTEGVGMVHPAQISHQGDTSGLDADLLDGQHGSYYLDTSATSQTKSGDLTVQGKGSFGSSSLNTFVLSIDGLGESYNGVSGSGKGAYNVAGTLATISATPNSVNSGALIDFNAYNSSGGATGAFIGAVAGSTGNGPANFVIGRRTGTTSWAESVRVDTAGKFGINTNAPLQTLDVRGNFLLAADGTTSTHITQKPYTINNGTLSWEGSAGQLFSITNNLTSGSIFSVNDVSGIPSIDVDANGTILFAPYGGNIGVGTLTPAQKLHVIGSIIASSDIIINQSAISYSSSDNTAVVGSITANKLHVNGSIQLTGNNDAIVFGRGTSSFMKDEEIGFGWGGGWYMTDSTFLRVRGSKTLYNDYIIRSDFDVRSPIFRDQDDPTNYYVDPSGTSRIGGIEIGSPSNTSNEIRFRGVNGDNPGGYDHAAIIERIWNTTDQSELLIFKGNDYDVSTVHDRIRIAATGRIVFDSYNGNANLTDYINARGTGNINGSMYINGNDVYVTGNVTATNYYGNGSNLTGITAGATLTNDTSTNATWYPTLSSSTSGTYTTAYVSNTKLTFNPSTGTLSATIFTSLSDETQKTNIEKITSAVDLTRQINGVKFEWKENGEKSAGVIAQEVEKIMPEIVHENDDGIKTVNYNGLVAVLIEALKEQQEQIDELKKAIKTHK